VNTNWRSVLLPRNIFLLTWRSCRRTGQLLFFCNICIFFCIWESSRLPVCYYLVLIFCLFSSSILLCVFTRNLESLGFFYSMVISEEDL
jgi:hypothetical protein